MLLDESSIVVKIEDVRRCDHHVHTFFIHYDDMHKKERVIDVTTMFMMMTSFRVCAQGELVCFVVANQIWILLDGYGWS